MCSKESEAKAYNMNTQTIKRYKTSNSGMLYLESIETLCFHGSKAFPVTLSRLTSGE
jgi:hypothetical protein